MATNKVHILGAGMAQWEKPSRKDEQLQTMNYETFLMFRFTFADGRRFHMPARISGMDDINEKGEVPSGFGYIDFHDEDKDFLYAYVVWKEVDNAESGYFTFRSGTGKWRGASGELTLDLWGAPAFANTVLPANEPVKFVGFLEGEGVLHLPHFAPAK
jgi:hypothetical protein